MALDRKVVAWFEEVGKKDLALVGGKGANLGELTQGGIPVPPGFIVTSQAYYSFLEESQLLVKIRALLKSLNHDDSSKLQEISEQIKELMMKAPLPSYLAQEVEEAYKKLGRGLVAVRSSATAEDMPDASFAGQMRTYLNVQGHHDVLHAIQGCWASLFEARAIFYRQEKGYDHFKVGIGVTVQRMVQSEASGVMFTVEPVSGNRQFIVVEAVLGLGEAIVSGEVTPDRYLIDKKEMKILERSFGAQEWKLVRNTDRYLGKGDNNVKVIIPEFLRSFQKLRDEDIIALAKVGQHIEEYYQFPQDIEWAREGKDIFIVQSRPVTTLKQSLKHDEIPELKGKVLLTGVAASYGIASGPVKIVLSPQEIGRVKVGDILVTEMTTPDFVPAMKRAVAIITEKGGSTSHAAIVSREMGTPCVVAAMHAITKLNEGQVITVDGTRGIVFEGDIKPTIKIQLEARERLFTVTRVYVNLSQPEFAERVAARHVDGVGLLRAEFMISQIGEHPQYMLKQGKRELFVEKMADGLRAFAKAFNPRPVVYRATDFKTNEYRNLVGGQEFETQEENPMLGYRGCLRYISEPEVFNMELEAMKRVRQEYKNLWLMIPFVRTVKEISEAKRMVEASGLYQSEDFKLWMMVEVPSNVFLIDKFLDVGIDGVSIGSNDLTQLIMGIDRDSARLAKEFDERNEAVLIALEKVIKACSQRKVTASICGQAPSNYPDLTAKLVEWGIKSVSVNPDMIDKTREIVAEVEARLSHPMGVRLLTRNLESTAT